MNDKGNVYSVEQAGLLKIDKILAGFCIAVFVAYLPSRRWRPLARLPKTLGFGLLFRSSQISRHSSACSGIPFAGPFGLRLLRMP